MKPLISLLFAATLGMAQTPKPIEPPRAFPLTEHDIQDAAQPIPDIVKFLNFIWKVAKPAPPKPQEFSLDPARISSEEPNQRRTFEIQREDLDALLRRLAKQAKINLVVENGLKQQVTFRMENKTPKEMIEILCVAKGLRLHESSGIYYVWFSDGLNIRRSEAVATWQKAMLDAWLSNGFTRPEAVELVSRYPNGFALVFDGEQPDHGKTSKVKFPARPIESRHGKQVSTRRVPKDIPEKPRDVEISGESLAETLRKVGREANMEVFVQEDVHGSVNLRLEDKTPREVFDILIQANGLNVEEINGVHYVQTFDAVRKHSAEQSVRPAKLEVQPIFGPVCCLVY